MPEPRAHPGHNSHHVRKVIRVGNSVAVTIPPHVLDHLRVDEGDWLLWDLSCKHYGILSRVEPPPYATQPAMFPPTDDENAPRPAHPTDCSPPTE